MEARGAVRLEARGAAREAGTMAAREWPRSLLMQHGGGSRERKRGRGVCRHGVCAA